MTTRIDILSGFLGAGKTTLLLKLLQCPPKGEKIAICENEYGEVGIDGDALQGGQFEVMEINAGCVCCTLAGNLISGIKLLVAQHHPDRILLEPTGLAGLADILNILGNGDLDKYARIGTAAAVADGAALLKNYSDYRRYFDAQLGSASVVYLNRAVSLDDGQRIDLVDLIREINPRIRVVAEPFTAEEAWQALDAPHTPPDGPWPGLPKSWLASFRQLAVPTGWKGSRERLERFLQSDLPVGRIVRAKGYVYDGEGVRWRVDLAGEGLTFEEACGGPDCLQLIGRNLAVNKILDYFKEVADLE